MLVTHAGELTCCWQVINVGKKFFHLCHQHRRDLSFQVLHLKDDTKIKIGHQDSKIVTNFSVLANF